MQSRAHPRTPAKEASSQLPEKSKSCLNQSKLTFHLCSFGSTWRTTRGMASCTMKAGTRTFRDLEASLTQARAGAAEEDPVLTFAFHTPSHKLVLDVAEDRAS